MKAKEVHLVGSAKRHPTSTRIPYKVTLTARVFADNPEEAEEIFEDEFFPEREVVDRNKPIWFQGITVEEEQPDREGDVQEFERTEH